MSASWSAPSLARSRLLQEAVVGLGRCGGAGCGDGYVGQGRGGLHRCGDPVASAVAAHVRMQELQPFYGAAVFTGSPDEEGDTIGLSVLRGAWLQHVATGVDAATRAEITARGEQFAAQFH
jgi:hypothetical protein